MGSLVENILKSDAPVLEYYVQMNHVYLIIDMNDACYRGQDFSSITVVVTAYNEDAEGNLNPDDVISTFNRTYNRYQIVHAEDPEQFLPYNLFVTLDNHWYDIQLNFNFEPNSDQGGNTFQSKTNTWSLDNRYTKLTGEFMSAFFTGHLKDDLQKNGEFTVWFDTLTPGVPSVIDYTVNDLVSNANGTIVKQITEINETTGELTVLSAEENYKNIVFYLLRHKYIKTIITKYFGTVPKYGEFTFQLDLNNNSYLIHFKGDLRNISIT